MKKLFIVTGKNSFDSKKECFTLGGVQTYIRDLARLSAKCGYDTFVFCNSDKDYSIDFEGYKVVGIRVDSLFKRRAMQKLYDKIINDCGGKNAKIIIASDQFRIKARTPHTLAIQHGVAFDKNYDIPKNKIFKRAGLVFVQILRFISNVLAANYVDKMVMVDYNYFNWHQMVGDTNAGREYFSIPNFSMGRISADALRKKLENRGAIKIVFARRFQAHRGTIAFINVAKRLLREFDDIEITFAGNGPLVETVRKFADENPRCALTSYESDKSIEFHEKYDIVAVPTLSSEGTSLSLLDAMGAGCLPVSTCVGGLSNIIIDGFNGFSVLPFEESLYSGLKKAIQLDRSEFDRIATAAFETATFGFSKEAWEARWRDVFEKI